MFLLEPGQLSLVIQLLQETCDNLSKDIISEMQQQRKLNEIVQTVQRSGFKYVS